MRSMARKKIVFVIVEGPTDDEALGVMLDRIFDKYTVHVEIMRCDITTERGVGENRVVAKVGKAIRDFAAQNHYTVKDFKEVIHIVDTDGAFIPDECVLEDPGIKRIRYEDGEIIAKNRDAIVSRNRQKSTNLRVLVGCSHVLKTIPYHVYYMSCNLDHVLHDNRNSTNDQKCENAYRFAKKYKNDVAEFITYISASDFSVMDGYKSSWQFIDAGTNSLNRYTNLGLCFERYFEREYT